MSLKALACAAMLLALAALAPIDSVERFIGLGVRVIKGHATFKDHWTVAVGDQYEIRARRFVRCLVTYRRRTDWNGRSSSTECSMTIASCAKMRAFPRRIARPSSTTWR